MSHEATTLSYLVNDYVLVDVKTTGRDYYFDEIIEIGLGKVLNNNLIEKFVTLVKPSRPIDEEITEITGITSEMLINQPSFRDILPKVKELIGDLPLVAHSVTYERNFLKNAFERYGGSYLENEALDVMRFAKKLELSNEDYKLSTLANKYNHQYFTNHRSENDILATYELYQYIQKKIVNEKIDLIELFKPNRNAVSYNDFIDNLASNEEVDKSNPIYGKSICFTGTLSKMERKKALALVNYLGGIPTDSVTKKTNYLVLGDVDYSNARSGVKSNKYLKAEKLMESGLNIKIISETQFLDLVDDDLEKKYYRE